MRDDMEQYFTPRAVEASHATTPVVGHSPELEKLVLERAAQKHQPVTWEQVQRQLDL